MSRRLFTALLGLLLWVSHSLAEEHNPPGPDLAASVDLPGITAYARANNPEIRAMEQRWRAAQARPSQAGSLPDPTVSMAYHNQSFDRFQQGRSDMAWLQFGAEQELPFPGKLALKETSAAREAEREGNLYRATVLNVLARLRVAFDDYFLAHKSIEIVRNSKELLEDLTRTAEARYQVGDGLQQDVARAQVELSILLGRLTSLEQQRQSAGAILNGLLDRPPASPLGPPAPLERPVLPRSLGEIEALARDNSPSLKAAAHEMGRTQADLDFAKRAYYPDFVLRGDYINKAAILPEWELGVGIRVPLYFWRKQAFGVQEAAATANEARAAKDNTSQDVLAKINDLYAQAMSADRLVDLYGSTVVPQAEVSLRSASAGYEVGKVDFLTVLNSFTVLNEYRLRYYEELAKLDKAIAGIEEITDQPSRSDSGAGHS
jgi:outer membrane protein, heavy metal efflux system